MNNVRTQGYSPPAPNQVPVSPAPSPEIVRKLQQALVGGEQHLLERIPTQIALIIERGVWKQCLTDKGQPFTSFEAFVTAPLLEGLGSTIDDLLAFCRKRPEIQALIRGEVGAVGEHGANQHGGHDNVMSYPEQGNNATYALRRLKRDRPDLAAQVVSGAMSAHAAAVEAGFRKRTISVAIEVPAIVAMVFKHCTAEQRSLIKASL